MVIALQQSKTVTRTVRGSEHRTRMHVHEKSGKDVVARSQVGAPWGFLGHFCLFALRRGSFSIFLSSGWRVVSLSHFFLKCSWLCLSQGWSLRAVRLSVRLSVCFPLGVPPANPRLAACLMPWLPTLSLLSVPSSRRLLPTDVCRLASCNPRLCWTVEAGLRG